VRTLRGLFDVPRGLWHVPHDDDRDNDYDHDNDDDAVHRR